MTARLQGMLAFFKKEIEGLFGKALTGIYLTGSIVLNGFHEGKSDADCIVLLNSPLNAEQLAALEKVHRRVKRQYRVIPLECQYILREEIGKTEGEAQPFYAYHDGKLSLGKFNANAVTWFTLKRYGTSLAGTPAQELDLSASSEDLKAYVRENVNTYWQRWLKRAYKRFTLMGLFALTDRAVEWCVCGISRMYFTLTEGDIVSKDGATEYALMRLPAWTHPILREALHVRNGSGKRQYTSAFQCKKDMLRYLAYAIELCNALPDNP